LGREERLSEFHHASEKSALFASTRTTAWRRTLGSFSRSRSMPTTTLCSTRTAAARHRDDGDLIEARVALRWTWRVVRPASALAGSAPLDRRTRSPRGRARARLLSARERRTAEATRTPDQRRRALAAGSSAGFRRKAIARGLRTVTLSFRLASVPRRQRTTWTASPMNRHSSRASPKRGCS